MSESTKYKRNKNRKSIVWEIFDKSDSTHAVCKVCNLRYTSSGNTSNLIDHFKRKHPVQWSNLEDENKNTDEPSDEPLEKQRKLQRSTLMVMTKRQQQSSWEQDSEKKKKLDRLYISMIAEDMESLRYGENKGFQNFINALEPKYIIPSTTFVKEKLLPAEYERVKQLLYKELETVTYCSVTTDIWTSIANEGLLGVTCHYVVDTSPKLKSVALTTIKIEQNHTADVICSVLDDVLKEWNIRNKVSAIVTDNAQNMINACKLLKIRHIPCFGHTLNLIVQDCYKLHFFENFIKKCKAIATFFRSSTLAADKLRYFQNLNNKKLLKPIQEVSTRWNSTFFMLKRIINIRTELVLAANVCEKAPPLLQAEEFAVMEELVLVLEPFEIATNEISGEQYVTISLAIPLIRGILNKLNNVEVKTEEGKLLLSTLTESIKKRLKPYETRTPCIMGSILDPRIKKAAFKTVEEGQAATQLLINELTVELNAEKANIELTPVQQSLQNQTESSEKVDEKASLLDFLQVPVIKTSVSDAIIDVRQYLEKPNISWNDCPFTYWKMYNTENKLWKLAYKFLCIPATSCPSERLFSKAGCIMNQKRSQLKSTTLDKLLFLKQNSRQFDR